MTASLDERIRQFLDGGPHAVVGASENREKYGNKVLRAYLQNVRTAIPVNPSAIEIEGQRAYATLQDVPQTPYGISVITPPEITEQIVEQAVQLGIKHVWMQPGAESEQAILSARQHGLNVIGGDACILVTLGYRE